ncbi:unnamed protein product [Moneuplotes crassus]|uniref:Uncharacterized protein n=1 Tax=Euplotes crassus TaxID=5936 RepID=A0AAD1UFH3_EUPCR|nr:unnamed protein product [Moneuplotes crassus]
MDKLLKRIEHKNLEKAVIRNRRRLFSRDHLHQSQHLSRNVIKNSLTKNSVTVLQKLKYLKALETIEKEKSKEYNNACTLLNYKLGCLDEKSKVKKKTRNKRNKFVIFKKTKNEDAEKYQSSKSIMLPDHNEPGSHPSMLPNLVALLNPSKPISKRMMTHDQLCASKKDNFSTTLSLPQVSPPLRSLQASSSSNCESSKDILLVPENKGISKTSSFCRPISNRSQSDFSSDEELKTSAPKVNKPKWLEIPQETKASWQESSFNGNDWIKNSQIFQEALNSKRKSSSKIRCSSRNQESPHKNHKSVLDLSKTMYKRSMMNRSCIKINQSSLTSLRIHSLLNECLENLFLQNTTILLLLKLGCEGMRLVNFPIRNSLHQEMLCATIQFGSNLLFS